MSCVNIRLYQFAQLVFGLLSLMCCEYVASCATCAAIVRGVNLSNVGRHSQWQSLLILCQLLLAVAQSGTREKPVQDRHVVCHWVLCIVVCRNQQRPQASVWTLEKYDYNRRKLKWKTLTGSLFDKLKTSAICQTLNGLVHALGNTLRHQLLKRVRKLCCFETLGPNTWCWVSHPRRMESLARPLQ
jgi:hypothetical protein